MAGIGLGEKEFLQIAFEIGSRDEGDLLRDLSSGRSGWRRGRSRGKNQRWLVRIREVECAQVYIFKLISCLGRWIGGGLFSGSRGWWRRSGAAVRLDQVRRELEHLVAIDRLLGRLEIVGIRTRIGALGVGDGGEDLDDSRVGRGASSRGRLRADSGRRRCRGIIEVHKGFMMRVGIWFAAAKNGTVGIADGLVVGG